MEVNEYGVIIPRRLTLAKYNEVYGDGIDFDKYRFDSPKRLSQSSFSLYVDDIESTR